MVVVDEGARIVPGIVWVASYPKSGNTWLRIFLANYLDDGDQAASINALSLSGPVQSIASGRHLFSDMLGIDASDLSHDEYDELRPDVYRQLAQQSGDVVFVKIHDANVRTASGTPLVPPDSTRSAIYLVRNPLDVAPSLARHAGWSLDETIRNMGTDDFAFCSSERGLPLQLRQRLLTWSAHVESWTSPGPFPVHVMRYEDMLAAPVDTFSAALTALGLPLDVERVQRAVDFSAFGELRRQEDAHGFAEAPPTVDRFFHEGRAGAWRAALTGAQVDRLVAGHARTMRAFGYLDADGRPC